MATRKARPKLVTVWWTDACTRSEQHDFDPVKIAEAVGLYHNRETSGYLIWTDAEKTILAHDWDAEENEVGHYTVIPTPWIKRTRGFPRKEANDGAV